MLKISLGVDNVHIIKVGLNYEDAPIEIREKLTFSEETIGEAMLYLNTKKSMLENVIFSTCNRTEIYAVVDQIHVGRHQIKQFLGEWFQIDQETFTSYLQIEVNDAAIKHLFRVSVGLNSMVLGETQILGQVRDAFLTAQKIRTTGTIFNELFKQVITFAKRAHRDTVIGEQAVSVSYAAVELAKKIFGNISNKRIVILGAGEMGELTLRNLHGAGATKITVVNRTLARAEKLAKPFHAQAVQTDQLQAVMKEADILISSTTSEAAVLTKEDLLPIQKHRKGNPLFIVDIAVPRDLDGRISELDSVFLYDIDDLQHVVDQNMESRQEAAKMIEADLNGSVLAFKDWIRTLGVVPVLTALREKALYIQGETMDSIHRKMPDLTEREQKVLNKHTTSIVNQLLKEPIKQAKELANKEDPVESLNMLIDIFGLDEQVKTDVREEVDRNRLLGKEKQFKKRISPLTE